MTAILHLTDLHLLSDAESRLKGVPTRETLRAVLEHVREHHAEAEVIVITGDFAHDEDESTYRALRELLCDLVERCLFVPGNHDNRAAMRAVFGDRIPDSGSTAITFSAAVGAWQLVGADSHQPGELSGRIDAVQLDWLKAELHCCGNRPVALFLHHPPVKVGCEWLDEIRLQDAEPFLDLVAANPHVRFVCAGHVHHEFSGQIGDAGFFTTPSTAIQFRPHGTEPGYESLPPGYRVIRLDGETYETSVVRLPDAAFPPLP